MRALILTLAVLFVSWPAWGGVFHVNRAAAPGGDGASWATALQTIQPAIDAAFADGGGEVWVAAGVYTGTADPETGAMLVMRPGVSLYGGFVGSEVARAQAKPELQETLLDARTALDGGPAEAVVKGAEGTVLDGFVFREDASTVATVRMKRAMTVSRCLFEAGSGSCIYALNAEDVVLRGLRFERNSSIFLNSIILLTSSPYFILEHCVFLENTGSALLIDSLASGYGRLNRVVFLRNTISGYLINLEDISQSSQPVISNSWFEENATILATVNERPIFINSVFKSNQGVLVINEYDCKSSATDAESFLEGEEWEGELCPGSQCPPYAAFPTYFVHCSFIDDQAQTPFSMLRKSLSVINSVFYENISDRADYYCDSPIALNSLFQKPSFYSGTGHLVGDPGFIEPGDIRPGSGSVLLNAGLDTSALEFGAVTTDIVGRPRGVHGAGYDLGAYQSGHAADINGDQQVRLGELLRVIQLYNFGALHCDLAGEDGYGPGPGLDFCAPHSSDYNPQDWQIGLGELLRTIQFYNSQGYSLCAEGEDGYCVESGVVRRSAFAGLRRDK